MFDGEDFVPFLVFSIPIIAIVGGIVVAVVKAIGRQRLMEMAQQERIAAIQRGIDPASLPPLPAFDLEDGAVLSTFERDRRRAQGLLIGGVITSAAGAGIVAFLTILENDRNVWAVGIIPMSVGVALMICSALVWPRGDASRSSGR